MTFSASSNPTMMDLKNAQNWDGSIGDVIEILNQEDEGLFSHMTMTEGNMESGHRSIQRYALPTPSWRKFNSVTAPTKAKERQITDTCGMLEDWSEVDCRLADLNGNSAAWRAQQDKAHVQGMREEFSSTFWYGNDAINSEEFTGMTERYDDSTASTDNPQGEHVLKSGTTPNASIWLINFAPDKVHGIYPKGTQGGLQVEDLGIETKETSSGLARVYRTYFKWDVGLSVENWKAAGRIQVDYSELTKDAATGPDLTDLMAQIDEMISKSDGRTAWFCGRGIKSYLRRQIANKVSNSTLSMESVGGKPVMVFGDVPVFRSDSLTYTESAAA